MATVQELERQLAQQQADLSRLKREFDAASTRAAQAYENYQNALKALDGASEYRSVRQSRVGDDHAGDGKYERIHHHRERREHFGTDRDRNAERNWRCHSGHGFVQFLDSQLRDPAMEFRNQADWLLELRHRRKPLLRRQL